MTQKIRIVQGGTSASKTVSILMYLIHLAQSDKTPTLTSVISESIPHLKRGAIRDFKKIMQEHGYWNDSRWNKTDSIYKFETGSEIEFFSADNADKLRGGRRDREFMNEANNMTLDAFDQTEVRTKEFVYIDYNPTNEFWALTEVKDKRPDVDFVILTYKDNEGCPEEIIKSIESRRNRKDWYKVYGEGLLGEIEGRIYTGWKIIDEVPHEARLEGYGLDFGYHPDPAVIVAVYYYNGGWILDEKVYRLDMSNREIANTLKVLPEGLVIADGAEPKSIDEIRAYGINIQACKKGHDSKKFGIKLIQDQPISITKQSVNGIKEYRNYLWKVDKNGNIIAGEAEEGNDHFMDAMRYKLETMGRLKQEKDYWDKIFEKELNPQKVLINFNKGK